MSSSTPSLKPDVNLGLRLHDHDDPIKPEDRGIRLIQLLLTCAAHAASNNLHNADTCLRQISELASVSGDSMQRLAARFASALAIRLIKRWPGLYKSLNHDGLFDENSGRVRLMFTRAFPYLGFAYAIMARHLLQALSDERVIHIIDLGSGDPKMWVPLLQSFAQTPRGPPHLKITCVHSNKLVLETLGPRLVKEAESLDMPFQFSPLNVGLRDLTLDMLKVRSGEALALTSVLNLHVLLAEVDRVKPNFETLKIDGGVKDSKQMGRFLSMIRQMSPKVFLLVEQESDHNSSHLVDRFIEGLHYYSAIFDSIDARFGGFECEERLAMEEMFGKEIKNIVACEGVEREVRHERYAKWMVRFARAGFKPVHMWYNSIDDTKQMVEAHGHEGYKIVGHKTSLMICWHDRSLYAVSAWNC